MRRAIITLLVLLSFGLKAQVYQAMPQAGYGPVKRMLFDSVLTIPLNINQLRNITGGRDAGQIRYNVTDSGLYVFSGYQWIKANLDSTNISNRINGKLNISDTAQMLSVYMKYLDTLSLSNRINLRVKYSDTAAMLLPYLRKLDTASLSRRIDKKQDSITLTTNFKSGAATLIGATLNIPKYSDTLQDNYVPYVGAIKDVDLGAYQLNANSIKSDYLLQVKNTPFSITPTSDYTSITPDKTGFVFYTSWLQGQSTYTQSNRFNYANQAQQNNTREYNLPVRNGTLALVEDTVNLSNRINLKADKATVLTINGVGYDLSANRTWTIPTFDSTSISNRINLKLNISDTASMLSPYLRKADTSSLSNRIDLRVKYSDTAAMLSPYLKSAVTSVGLSMPSAFNVSNSPITSTGTLAVTGAGTAAQYIRGDGQLGTLPPSNTGSGSSVNYYLNGGVSQGTIGGSTYYQMSKDAVIGTTATFTRLNSSGDGLIAQFITDVADPNRLEIPSGAWNFELFFSASSSGGSPAYYVELLKYNGSTFTSIASNSATTEVITGGTATDLYLSSLAIPYTTLSVTDRLVVRVYVITSGKNITLHTQNGNLCQIVTTFPSGMASLNGLTANTQYLATDTLGSDFNISSVTDTHKFNLPTASASKRGALSSADWNTFNGKMNFSDTASLSNRINTKLNSSDTASLSNRINAKADALSGTTNTVPKFTSGTTIGNSNIKDDGSAVSVNTTAGSFGALQVGSYNGNILMNTTNTNGGLIFQNTSSSNKLWDFSSDNNDLVFNESNVAPVMKLKAGGNVVISNLSGTGTRMVVADLNGVLSTQAISSDTTSLSNRINLKLNISDTASMLSGYQSAINSKQGTITLTTTGTSGAATFSSNTLNIPQYQAAGTYVTSVTGTSPIVSSGGTTPAISIPAATSSVNGYLSSTDWTTFNNKSNTNGTVTSVAALTLGTSGTDLSSTVANGSTTPVITLNVPTASASNRGALSSADWTTFNSKQSALTNPVTGTGTANYHAKFTGSTTLGNSLIWDNGTNVGIGNTNTSYIFDVTGTARFTGAITGTIESLINTSTGFALNATSAYTSATSNNPIITFGRAGSAVAGAIGYDDNLGSLYIGTTTGHNFIIKTDNTPRLTIASTGAASFSSSVTSSFGSSGANFNSNAATTGAVNAYRVSNTTGVGSYGIESNAGGDLMTGGLSNATLLQSISNTALQFGTNQAARMTITSGGNVGIGTTTDAGYKLDVNGTVRTANLYFSTNSARIFSGAVDFAINNSTNTVNMLLLNNSTYAATFSSSVTATAFTAGGAGSGGAGTLTVRNDGGIPASIANEAVSGTLIRFSGNGSGVLGSISHNGSVTSYNVTSDYRLKEDFIQYDGLSLINKVKTYDYKWKTSNSRMYGVIAHELQEVIPYAVQGVKDAEEMQSVDYSKLVPIMVNAIKELSAQIKELQTEIQTLKNK